MGEPSAELTAPLQPKEVKDASLNCGLSVNGSQIVALERLNELKEGIARQQRSGLLARIKNHKSNSALGKINTIETLILEGRTKEAQLFLDDFDPDVPIVGVIDDKLAEGAEAINLFKKAIVKALSENISAEEVCKNPFRLSGSGLEFPKFIKSIPGRSLSQLPNREMQIYLTQLGIKGFIDPKSNMLRFYPEDSTKGLVSLPADQQHPLYVEEREILGEPDVDNMVSRLEIFIELTKRYPKVFTHITAKNYLPDILSSGFVGRPYERGYHGIINSERGGVYIEPLTFKDLPEYTRVIDQLKSNKKFSIPEDIPKDRRFNFPLHETVYTKPNSISPIAIFSDKFSQRHRILGWLADDVADIKDECLVGIIVTPQYKKHLLHWISTWSDERRKETFGERKPEDVLISRVEDLPALP